MEIPDLVGLFVGPLERLGIPYMVTGGVASTIYGDPRFTRDIDLVLQLDANGAEALVQAFDPAAFYVPPLEAVLREAARERHGHFNVIHQDSALRADVYLLTRDPLHAWAFENRRRLPLDALEIWLAPIEYVILRKLEYYRDSGSDRHLSDVNAMLRISQEIADLPTIRAWVDRLGLGDVWRAVVDEEA